MTAVTEFNLKNRLRFMEKAGGFSYVFTGFSAKFSIILQSIFIYAWQFSLDTRIVNYYNS